MNYINQDGREIIQEHDSITVNGVRHEIPKWARRGNSIKVLGDRIIVNGFRFDPDTGEFTKRFPFWILAIIGIVTYMIISL